MSKNNNQNTNENNDLLATENENNAETQETRVNIDENLINSIVEQRIKAILKEKEQEEQKATEKAKELNIESKKDNGYLTPEQTKVILDKEEKVDIKIMLDKNNKTLTHEEVIINGYRYSIKKGEEILVPTSVKKVLREAGII